MAMHGKTLIGLAAAAAVATVAAVVVNLGDETRSPPGAGERLFPQLAERINEATTVRIEGSDAAFTVKRTDDGWTMPTKDGYPVRFGRVKATLLGLARLEKVEPKTNEPERYAALEVGDPTREDAKSTRLVVEDADGAVLADLIVGKRPAAGLGGERSAVYVRRADAARAWLAAGDLELGRKPTDWLAATIADVDKQRVRKVNVVPPDGPPLVVVREAPDKDLAVRDLPAGTKVGSPSAVRRIGAVLEGLELKDVRRAEDIDFGGAEAWRAEFVTFDGLVVRVRLVEHEGATWARFTTQYVPPEAPPAETEAGTNGGKKSAAADKAEKKGSDASALRPAEAVREEAAKLNARLDGWAYRLPTSALDRLRSRRADVITEKEEKDEAS